VSEVDGAGTLMQAAANASTPADYLRTARALRESGPLPGIRDLRVAVLASHSMQFSEPYLAVEGLRRGLRLSLLFAPFGQLEQPLLDPENPLWQFNPDVVLIAFRPEDVDPDVIRRFHATGGDQFRQVMSDLGSRIEAAVRRLRERSHAAVLVANAALPSQLPFGLFDANEPGALSHGLPQANAALAARARGLPGVSVWDYAGLVAAHGSATWTDPRLWALGRIAVSGPNQVHLGRHLARTIAALVRPPAKVLVLDLDHTLWGGVIGDDGLAGIELGDDYPGSVFKSFQRAVLGLADRGILLAVASKNSPETVAQVFREHPEMLLREKDLVASHVNWGPKSRSLLAIAEELNLGADALVFFDDNPVERAEVRANAPAVAVIEVPADPLRYEAALLDSGFFDQVMISEEDRGRTTMYHQERERKELAGQFTDLSDFLKSLEMRAVVGRAGSASLGRIAQLVAKTNQFNLTTRRHDEATIAGMAGQPDYIVAWLRLTDRFGDQGVVAVGIVAVEAGVARVDTLLMSCRVMNRQVETALMAYLVEGARQLGAEQMVGVYLPTRKNGMVEGFYPGLGFEQVEGPPGGGLGYRLDLRSGDVAWPGVIAREDATDPAIHARS